VFFIPQTFNQNGHTLLSMWTFQSSWLPKKSWFFVVFANPYNDGVTFCKCSTSPQLDTPMCTKSHLFNKKCNIMLSLDKSLCKTQWCTTFIMFMNAHANFTWFCLKVVGHVCLSIWAPLAALRYDYLKWGSTSCCNPTLLKEFPHSTTMCMPPCFLCGWQGIW
jgi:hypothetical protein